MDGNGNHEGPSAGGNSRNEQRPSRRQTRELPAPWCYTVALILPLLALLLYSGVSPLVGRAPWPILFIVPIVLSAYPGGIGPGLLATLLSVGAAFYCMWPVSHGLSRGEPIDYVRLGTLLLSGVLISALGELRRRGKSLTRREALATELFSLERKVQFGFALAAIALVSVGAFTYTSVTRFREDAGLVEHTHQVLNALMQVLSGLTSAESGQRRFEITGQEEDLQTYQEAVQTLNQQTRHLRALTADNPTQQQNLDALEPLLGERLRMLLERIELRRARGRKAAEAAFDTRHDEDVEDGIHSAIDRMEGREYTLLGERETRAQESNAVLRTEIVAGSMVALSLLVAALFYVERDFARSRSAEEQLRLARDTLEGSVRQRSDEVIKSGMALRAGEERMARIINSAMDAILTIDEEQRITLFNPAAERMFGCPAADAIGAPLERFLPARFRGAHGEHIRAFGQHGVTRRTMGGFRPLSGLRTNGEEFPIEASISQIEVDGRKVFTAIVRDVTEMTKARETSSRLAAIVENSEDAIISQTLDGVVTSWNPAAERLFRYAAEEAIGRYMATYFSPERRELEREILQRIKRGGSIDHFESQQIRKDGQWVDVAVTISPLRDNSGRVIGASSIARDITEYKRAEEEIRQQARLLDLAPVLVRDIENRIVLWTLGAEELYGYTREEALGRVSHELLQTEFPQPLEEIEKTLGAHGVWEGELGHLTRDGNRLVVASQWVVYHDSKGNPIRTLEVNADITALKRAETLQMRSQKLEALGTLAGGIAHDFNNILSAINGSAALAISQFPADHPVQACLVEIEKAGLRATELVRRILSFSRPQEQNMAVQDLHPVVVDALKLVRATIPAMTEIRYTHDPDLPMARVDAAQIYQVVLNLATNAAHAIGNKSGLMEVKLDTLRIREEELKLYAQIPAGHYVRLTVSDTGCGMTDATLERVFDPFFTTKPVGRGTGLGMSVVHGIVAAHLGFLRVYSEPDKGTAFQIYFPAAEDAAPALGAAKEAAPAGRGERILYVDDEGVLVFLGTMKLEQSGYKVTGVSSGIAALREFQQRPDAFDAVITDLSMPVLSGLQLTRELRELRADIPILLTSGYFSLEDKAIASQLGVRALLTKPVNPKHLLAILHAMFEDRVKSASSGNG